MGLRGMLQSMGHLRAKVQNGRLVLDEPTDLPDGTVLELVVDDHGDTLSDAERTLLDDTLSRAWASVQAGHVVPVEEVLAELNDRK